MFKKISQQSGNVSLKCTTEHNGINKAGRVKHSEFSLLNLIGSLNIKRWNALKTAFACKSNEKFVTKLLDIAQDHFKREKGTEENITSANVTRGLGRINKNKKNNCNKGENDYSKGKAIINDCIIKDNSLTDKSSVNHHSIHENGTTKYTKSNTEGISDINNFDLFRTNINDDKRTQKTLPLSENKKKQTVSKSEDNDIKKLDNKYNEVKENESVEISSNLDITQNRICQYCSVCHANKECFTYYPRYKIQDSIDLVCWSENYKETYNNIKNSKIKSTEKKEKEKYSYSVMSLPNILYFADTNTNHGLGVFAKNDIQPFSQFGPLVGKIVREVDIPEDFNMKDLWEINYDSGNIYVNTECITISNWLKYIRPAPKKDAKNVIVVSREKKLYFITVTFIKTGEELLYWQDSPFATNKKKMEKSTCGGCNMVFSHPHYYRIHCSVFHDLRYSLTIRKYHCKICGAAVMGKENIMKHAADLHNGQGAYQCQFCKKFFLRLNYLEMHRTYGCSANPHRSKPLCDFCGRKFCQPQKLKVHIKRMHSDFSEVLKEFQCKSCLKILGSRAALQRHSKEVHRKQIEDACSCARCGKRFQNKSNLKIHMLTHSGIKPFRCSTDHCNVAFTTKQCLQFHYKKVHNFTEQNMPKIERSVDYTFQAYSGLDHVKRKEDKTKRGPTSCDEASEDSDNDSLESPDMDNPGTLPSSPLIADEQMSAPNPDSSTRSYNNAIPNSTIKVLSKGSKKWIADDPSHSESVDLYVTEKINKDELTDIQLQETEIYNRNRHIGIGDFNRQETSNASLLVEAALDSVCSEPNIDIDAGTTPNCNDSLVNNLYSLTQPETLPDVSYTDTTCINESRDINLIAPVVNNQISVNDEFNNDMPHDHNMRMDYSSFHQENFDSSNSPGMPRPSFVRHYVNNVSSHNTNYDNKNVSPVASPPRHDFSHSGNTDQLSSDDSNGMSAQNLSLHNSKTDIQLDLSIYKSSYKANNESCYIRRTKFQNNNSLLCHDQINELNQDNLSGNMQTSKSENKEINEGQLRSKYINLLSNNVHSKFEIDLDLRLKSYDQINDENLKEKNFTYDNGDIDFKSKEYDLIDVAENRTKQYENVDSDLRIDRSIEPSGFNSSELQGLDMSARSIHNYPNINRYHHLYPEVDRVDLRFSYSPPAPAYTHSDILRVVSLELTSPDRHSVDLSLRSHPLHQIANSRLLTEHGLQSNSHRFLDQSRLLGSDLNSARHLATDSRLISDVSSRILSEHTANRILTVNDQLTSNHLLNSEQNRLISDNSRIISDTTLLLEPGRLREGKILTSTTPSRTISPVPGFNAYSVAQSPYHPTPITPRQHVSSPTPYHYPSYY